MMKLPSKRAVLFCLIALTWSVIMILSVNTSSIVKLASTYAAMTDFKDSTNTNTEVSTPQFLGTTKNYPEWVHSTSAKHSISPKKKLKLDVGLTKAPGLPRPNNLEKLNNKSETAGQKAPQLSPASSLLSSSSAPPKTVLAANNSKTNQTKYSSPTVSASDTLDTRTKNGEIQTQPPLLPSTLSVPSLSQPKTVIAVDNNKTKETNPSSQVSKADNSTVIEIEIQPPQKSKSSLLPSNSATVIEELNQPNTTLTLDPELVVYCHKSPFIDCEKPSKSFQKQPSANWSRPFKIAVLRSPFWVENIFKNYKNCEYQNCLYTNDRDSKNADAVVIYAINLKDSFKPIRTSRDQIFVVSAWESPPHTHASFIKNPKSIWNYQFNLTMTYRVDSDVFAPYGRLGFSPTPLKERPNYYEIAQNKSRLVAWFTSNCKTPSKRLEYVTEMQKYVDVDIYGACGKPCKKGPNSPCMEALPSTYKFYLSFENSLCQDYISEKLFKLFVPNMHIIPVVRGHTDYDNHFPNYTMINAANFPNAKALALHLKELGSDLKTYSRYLEVKDLYKQITGIGRIGCELCKYLHTQKMESKIVDAKKWMSDGRCKTANDIT